MWTPSSSGRRSFLALLAAPAVARAAGWPERPIRLVIPFAPGGGADNQGRMLAEALARRLGQSIVVENKGGAGGTLAAQMVASLPADGYTLLYGTPGQLVTNPILMRDLPYDAVRDFAPVSLITRSFYAFCVNSRQRITGIPELIAAAKGGALSCTSPGAGSGPHLALALFNQMAGVEITHLPYRGSGPALQDLAGGQVPMSIDSLSVVIPLLQGGQARGLAVTSAQRSAVLPLPTVAETLPGYEVTVFNYIAARSGTPREIVERLSREIALCMREPQIVSRNQALAVESIGSTPDELGAEIASESVKWRRVIAAANIRLE